MILFIGSVSSNSLVTSHVQFNNIAIFNFFKQALHCKVIDSS